MADARAVVLGAVDVVAILLARNERDRHVRGALERVVDALIDVDVRVEAGDQDGAVRALRAWLRQVGVTQ
jgi:hypothetical protein